MDDPFDGAREILARGQRGRRRVEFDRHRAARVAPGDRLYSIFHCG
jgi:hypothetical protein